MQRPETPYWVFCLIAATAGLGGGNFAASMANINFFYPTAKKGTALGLNAAGGNIGVAVHPVLPADHRRRRGRLRPGQGQRRRLHLERAGYLYAALAVVAAVVARGSS